MNQLTLGLFSEAGLTKLSGIRDALSVINGAYFGLLQGHWPIHFLSTTRIPPSCVSNTDVIECKVYGYENGSWVFEPRNIEEGHRDWFQLEFDLPLEIALLVSEVWDDAVEVANLKRQHFSYINLSGMIEGIHRQIRLILDENWLNEIIPTAEN